MRKASIGTTAGDLEVEIALSLSPVLPAPATRLGRNFVHLASATAASNLSDGLRIAALPLLGALLTRNPAAVAGLHLAGQLPWLLFGLLSGAVVDRYDRRRLLMAAHALRCTVVAALTLSVVFEQTTLPLLYIVAFVLGTAETVFDNAAQALLPDVVDERHLERANGRLEIAFLGGNQFVGPALGAALFAAATVAPFALDAVALGVAVLSVGRIRTPAVTAAAAELPRVRLRTAMAQSLRWLWRQPVLRTLSLVNAVINFCISATIAITVLYALDVLEMPAGAYGLLLAGYAVGGVVGGALVDRVVARLGRARTIVLAVALGATSLLVTGLTTSVGVAIAMQGVLALGGSAWNVVTKSLRQVLTPREMLGRVIGAHRLLSWGAAALGAAAGGGLAAVTTIRTPFVVFGVVLAVLAVGMPALLGGRRAGALAERPAQAGP